MTYVAQVLRIGVDREEDVGAAQQRVGETHAVVRPGGLLRRPPLHQLLQQPPHNFTLSATA